jgi:hypothetical protein
MSKKQVDGVWVIVCDWVGDNSKPCDLGVYGEPKMFVDPDGGKNEDKHYQCGVHHGVVKQEDRPEYQVPEDHKLTGGEKENLLVREGEAESTESTGPKLEGFKPDAEGRVWDGTVVDTGASRNE